jgi:transcriptional regulator with XRE-family HTH domain
VPLASLASGTDLLGGPEVPQMWSVTVGEVGGAPSMQPELGRILRKLREDRGLPLAAVAAKTGLSRSFIHIVERGRSDLSVSRLMLLCDFYGLRPSELLALSAGAGSHELEPFHYVSPDEGSEIKVLGHRNGHGLMLPALTVYAPGARTDIFSHQGEEFIYVVSGRLNLELDGDLMHLDEGESRYFHGSVSHVFSNTDPAEPAVKLSVQSEIRW